MNNGNEGNKTLTPDIPTIIKALQDGQLVWTELKRKWNANRFPGMSMMPGEFLVQLIIGYLKLSYEDVAALMTQVKRIPLEELKRDKVLPFGFNVSEGTAVTFLAMLVGNPTFQIELLEPIVIEQPPIIQEIPIYVPCAECAHRSTEEPVVIQSPPVIEEVFVDKPCAECARREQEEKNQLKMKPVIVPVETVETTVKIDSAMGCSHVGSDRKCVECTSDETEDCTGCDTKTVKHSLEECKNCDNAYCSICQEDNLNEAGYCDNCSTLDCMGENCSNNDEVDAGSEISCSNEGCREDGVFCQDCALRYLNEQGLCSSCSNEEELNCAECSNPCTESKLKKCGNYEECSNAYCAECASNISPQGFCDDCNTLSCDGCQDDVTRGEEKTCKRKKCDSGEHFCSTCSVRLLNKKGYCMSCSGEAKLFCDGDCGDEFTASLLKKCKNFDDCQYAYCVDDKEELVQDTCPSCQNKG